MTTRDPLSGDRWRVAVAVIAAFMVVVMGQGIVKGLVG